MQTRKKLYKEVINDSKKDLYVELLYSDENIRTPIILFRILREYLILKDFCYRSDPQNQKIMFELIRCFIDYDSDKNYTSQQVATTKMPTKPSSSSDVVTVRTSGSNDDRSFAHNMASRFKRDDNFSEKLWEILNTYIANYMEAALDYKLNPTQKLRYFRDLFDGKAKSFYRNYVQVMCNTFE